MNDRCRASRRGPALPLTRDLVDEWRHHFAGAAPIGIEVDEDGNVALGDRAGEGFVSQWVRAIEQHGFAALAALRAIRGAGCVDAIPGLAELASDGDVSSGRCICRSHGILRVRLARVAFTTRSTSRMGLIDLKLLMQSIAGR